MDKGKKDKSAKQRELDRIFDERFKKKLISDKDLARIEEYLQRERRNQDDWDVIIEILHTGDVLTVVPQISSKHYRCVEDVLVYKDMLQTYTSRDKLKAYVKEVAKNDPNIKKCTVRTLSFEELSKISNRHNIIAVIDHREDGFFLAYKPDTERIEACINLFSGNPIAAKALLNKFTELFRR